jgi:hypothetical protein
MWYKVDAWWCKATMRPSPALAAEDNDVVRARPVGERAHGAEVDAPRRRLAGLQGHRPAGRRRRGGAGAGSLKFTGLTQNMVNSKALIGIFSQTAGSTCNLWVNPVDFTFAFGPGAPAAFRASSVCRSHGGEAPPRRATYACMCARQVVHPRPSTVCAK